MAAAGGAVGFGYLSSVAKANDDDCAGLERSCLDRAVTADGHAAAEDEKERKDDARSKKRRAWRRKANMAIEDRCEQGAAVYGDGDDEWAELEPLFFDEAATVAEHGRRMQREQQAAHNRKLCRAREAALNRIREYDPKTGSTYYSRVEHVDDIATFNHDEESPLGPMRDTEALIYVHGTVASDGEKKFIASDSANLHSIDITSFSDVNSKDGNMRFVPDCSANVFSVKIVSSDVGFPIEVYGTVIARDNIDLKCVYLFRRDRDHCQLILSKDESLILTGPKRGLALKYYLYFEFDLKIKCVGRQKNKQLSKGYMALDGLNYRSWQEMEVERETLDTKLSKVMITYAVVQNAVEATFAIEVLQGRFYGEITACTTGIRDSIVLHDSKMAEAMTDNGKGVIQLLRNVVAVSMREKLIFTIVARTGDGKTKSTTIRFTPGVIGGEEKEITCGSIQMCVKVTWSIVSRWYYPHC
ncbi:unnamed protein product [Miscanthus lutarioriparius]|uniref:DUF6598 domain-containing protein n=1 Tax=Miscanthus lutarioriparius TaxID=422564 RepID=A0A811STN5_9POAL|nr:unnamed protein product [Miscanthus lutarioriparius]